MSSMISLTLLTLLAYVSLDRSDQLHALETDASVWYIHMVADASRSSGVFLQILHFI